MWLLFSFSFSLSMWHSIFEHNKLIQSKSLSTKWIVAKDLMRLLKSHWRMSRDSIMVVHPVVVRITQVRFLLVATIENRELFFFSLFLLPLERSFSRWENPREENLFLFQRSKLVDLFISSDDRCVALNRVNSSCCCCFVLARPSNWMESWVKTDGRTALFNIKIERWPTGKA